MSISDREGYEQYINWRNQIYEVYSSACKTLEKNILLISSGAFGLTLSLIELAYKNERVIEGTDCLVKASWICFLLSILFILVANGTTILASYQYISNLDEAYEREEDKQIKSNSTTNILTAVFIIISIVFLVLGIFSFMFFAIRQL